MNEVEIFRAGDYGAGDNFPAEAVQKIAANFDPSKHRVPLVLGHPEHDSPAHGWVQSVRAVGAKLYATFSQVSEELKALVREGRYGPISVAIYRDLAGQGPTLRHIGFQGAIPPRVKGMKPVQFAEGEFADLTIDSDNANLTAFLSETEQETEMDPKDKSILQSAMDTIARLIKTGTTTPPSPVAALAEPAGGCCPTCGQAMPGAKDNAPVAAMSESPATAALKAREAEIAKAEAELKQRTVEANRKEAVAFAESLTATPGKRRLMPGQVAGFAEIFLPMSAEARVEFAEKNLSVIDEELFKRTYKPEEQPGGAVEFSEAAHEHTIVVLMSEYKKSRAEAVAIIRGHAEMTGEIKSAK